MQVLSEIHEMPIIVRIPLMTDSRLSHFICSVEGCNHTFCQACLVEYIQRQNTHSVALRHRCPVNDCFELVRTPPREIPMFTALAEALWFATRAHMDEHRTAEEWCSNEPLNLEGMFS